MRSEYDALRASQVETESDKQATITRLTAEIAEIKAAHAEQLASLEKIHQEKTTSLNQEHAALLLAAKESATHELEKSKSHYEKKLKKHKEKEKKLTHDLAEKDKRIESLQAEHEAKLAQALADAKMREEQTQSELADVSDRAQHLATVEAQLRETDEVFLIVVCLILFRHYKLKSQLVPHLPQRYARIECMSHFVG